MIFVILPFKLFKCLSKKLIYSGVEIVSIFLKAIILENELQFELLGA